MLNPLRSEAEAFRFLIASIAYFGAIVVASVTGGEWVGLGVFIALTAVVIGWWARARREERPPRTRPRPHAAGERRILVVANETVDAKTLRVIAEALAMQQTHANLPEPLRARLSESIEQLERLARRMGALLAEVTRRTPPRAGSGFVRR